jgi:CDP-4-dehydro-6-deoxyglucose reductase, E3
MQPAAEVHTARITSCTGTPVQRIVLEMPPAFRFLAGQYLQVIHPDGPIPLSIASAPWRLPELHLHYRSTPGLAEAARMDELLTKADRLNVSAAAGDVTGLAPPLLIVAGGTGIAQAMSFVDAFRAADPGGPVTLLWCLDQPEDAYLANDLTTLQAPWLKVSIVTDADRSADNRGLAWLRAHAPEFIGLPVLLAGGPGFVYAACDALLEAGLEVGQMRSDVFAYAPRAR